MREHKTTSFLILLTMATVVVTSAATMRGGSQDSSPTKKQKEEERYKQRLEFESQFPIVEFNSAEPDDPEERAKRRAKGNKHNKAESPLEDINEDDVIFSVEHWEEGLPALPVSQSQVIVMGRVAASQAFLSTDKTAVYSEFTVVIDEVFKCDGPEQLKPGGTVVADRRGGRVRFSSGSLTLSQIHGQAMPRTGRQYVLFLARRNQEENFSILTGYELKDGRVALLDNPGGGTHPISGYRGVSQTAFLEALRTAIAGKDSR